jgi:hypothetical protein
MLTSTDIHTRDSGKGNNIETYALCDVYTHTHTVCTDFLYFHSGHKKSMAFPMPIFMKLQ